MKKVSKVLAVLLAVVLFMGTGLGEIPVAAVTAINISNPSKPTTITEGKGFTCSGTISSSSQLTLVTGQIITASGTSKYVKSVNPKSTIYELSGSAIDCAMLFNKLPVGSYYYKISAQNASGANQVLVNQAFKVVAVASTLGISGQSTPGTITEGKSWGLSGTVSSNYTLTNVTGSISTSGGVVKYSKSITPSGKSYNLAGSEIDAALLFNMLSAGTYYYKITATDSSKKSLTLINSSFTVKKPASTLGISGQSTPTSFYKGTSWTPTGKITSNYNITKVNGYILASDASTKVYSKSVTPNAKSYSLKGSDIASALKFSSLDVGTYYYKVTAKDESGKSLTLINVSFKVTKAPAKKYNSNIKVVLKDVAEGSNKFVILGNDEHAKIWSWYYNESSSSKGAWCGAFTAYMMSLAGVNTNTIQTMAGTKSGSKSALIKVTHAVNFYQRNDENAKNDCFYPLPGYTDEELVTTSKRGSFANIKTGDLLIVANDNGPFAHIGMAYVDASGNKYIIHGNWSSAVCKNQIKENSKGKVKLYYGSTAGEYISAYVDFNAFLSNNGLTVAYGVGKIDDIPTYTIGTFTLGGKHR